MDGRCGRGEMLLAAECESLTSLHITSSPSFLVSLFLRLVLPILTHLPRKQCHYYKAAAYRITPHPPTSSSSPSTSAPAAAEPSNGVDHPKPTSTTPKRSHSIARPHKRPTPSLSIKHTNAVPHSVAEGNLSVDGERFPYDEFLVEVHPGLGRFLSLWGGYRADFKRE